MILSKVLFACPHCGCNDHATFTEPADGGGSRTMTLKGACFHCDKLYDVTVRVAVSDAEVAEERESAVSLANRTVPLNLLTDVNAMLTLLGTTERDGVRELVEKLKTRIGIEILRTEI